MLIQELTTAQCSEVLNRSQLGHLACARHNQPYVVPIHYSYDAEERCLYSFSAIGQKVAWMRDNPKVCVEVEDIADRENWTSIVVIGRYEEIHQHPDTTGALQRAERLLQQRPKWWFPGAARTTSREPAGVVIYRIQIASMSGRRVSRSRAE